MIINKDLHLKAFWKHLFSSYNVASFLRRCTANPTFLVLQLSFFIKINTSGSLSSEIKSG